MPDILIRGMEMPTSCDRCFVKPCKFRALEKRITVQRHKDCPLVELPQQTVETNLYDIEEIHHNCTVQILRNSVTGEVSVGWWPNEEEDDE